MAKILATGGRGLLGSKFTSPKADNHDIYMTFYTHRIRVDIHQPKNLTREKILRAYLEKDLTGWEIVQDCEERTRDGSIKHWLEHLVREHMFTHHLAYPLASVIQYKLRALSMRPPMLWRS